MDLKGLPTHLRTNTIKNLKEEINILRGRQSTLWGVCIVLTSIVTAMFMHMFIL